MDFNTKMIITPGQKKNRGLLFKRDRLTKIVMQDIKPF